MTENKLGDLVRKAKGEDRSLREYARNSGVDAAVLSKIINGSYIPKKSSIYRSLTSSEASPRGGVTYKQLVEAADTSKSYQRGFAAGMAATEVLLSAIGGLAIPSIGIASIGAATSALLFSKEKGGANQKTELVNSIRRFTAAASGLLYNSMASKGVSFQVVPEEGGNGYSNSTYTSLRIKNQEISEYIFRYAYFTDEHQDNNQIVENVTKGVIAGLIFQEPSKQRKTSIVTNSAKAYEYMRAYKNKLSYDGELSIILVDINAIRLVSEEYIAHCSEENAPKEMIIVS